MVPKELVNDHVCWGDPTNPGEVAQGLKEVTRHKFPQKHSEEGDGEETLARDTPARTNARVVLGMQGVEEGACDQVGRPNWVHVSDGV